MSLGSDRIPQERPEERRADAAARRWLWLGLACYGAVLVLLRPVTPFEWDEVLFQRALDHYDVLRHSPHPPGYPAYVGAGRVVRWVVGDPHLALQLVTIALAVATVGAVWTLVRRLGGSRLAAGLAAGVVATMPGFAFNANVGLSDVPGTAGGILTVLAFVAAAERPGLLPLAGLAAALTMGIRPQILPVFTPVAVWAIVRAVKSRRWSSLAAATATYVIVLLACWLPAVLLTGPARYAEAIRRHLAYMNAVEPLLRLPGAALSDVFPSWTVGPFVDWRFAVPLWVLIVAGAVVLVRTGRARLALVAGSAGGLYLLAGMFSMNMTATVRYALPAMPYLAILAAGAVMAPGRVVRRSAALLVALWAVAAVVWAAPAWRERLRPAPVWAALEWVQQHYDPARTRIVFDGAMSPHVNYLLARHGFSAVSMERASLLPTGRDAGKATLYVTPRPVAGGDVVFQDTVHEKRLLELAWHRYGSCAVTAMPGGDRPVFSPAWQVRGTKWQLWLTGIIYLPDGRTPRLVTLRAGTAPLEIRRAGALPIRLAQGHSVQLPLFPGEAGELVVTAPPHWLTVLDPPVIRSLAPGDSGGLLSDRLVVPFGDADAGAGGGRRADLLLYNPQAHPLTVRGWLLPGPGAAPGVREMRWTLGSGRVLTVPGVSVAGGKGPLPYGAAALAVEPPAAGCAGGGCAIAAFARTSRRDPQTGADPLGGGLPAVPAAESLGPAETGTIEAPAGGELIRLGAVVWSSVPVVLEVRLRLADGTVETARRTVPPLSCAVATLQRPAEQAWFRVVSRPGARVLPWGASRARTEGGEVVLTARRTGGGEPEGPPRER